jgi:hypothetical protein
MEDLELRSAIKEGMSLRMDHEELERMKIEGLKMVLWSVWSVEECSRIKYRDDRKTIASEKARSEDFIKLSGMRGFTKMAISGAAFGVRRPTSTTFVDIFKGYNAEVYTKIKFQVERGQKDEIVRRWK